VKLVASLLKNQPATTPPIRKSWSAGQVSQSSKLLSGVDVCLRPLGWIDGLAHPSLSQGFLIRQQNSPQSTQDTGATGM
jgi:hypothetical protein